MRQIAIVSTSHSRGDIDASHRVEETELTLEEYVHTEQMDPESPEWYDDNDGLGWLDLGDSFYYIGY